jgi:hypothetical protein
MSTGPLSYLYKKYVVKVQQYSPDAAKTLDRIRADFGPSAGYQSALALTHYIEAFEKTGQYPDLSRFTAYLRDYPMAVPQLRRALSYLNEDQQSEYHFRD